MKGKKATKKAPAKKASKKGKKQSTIKKQILFHTKLNRSPVYINIGDLYYFFEISQLQGQNFISKLEGTGL